MAIIKKSEFKQMNEAALMQSMADLNKELIKINTQRSTHTTLENPGRVKIIRKTIAKIKTKMHELKTNQKQSEKSEKEKLDTKPTAKQAK